MRATWLTANAIVLGILLASAGDAARPGVRQSAHAYGPAPRHLIDLYRPRSGGPAPILLFVHGGGWSEGSKAMGEGGQLAHFVSHGFAWASLDYRLVPQATVEDQAADVARAIAFLIGHARGLNLDAGTIILIGHSSGAQLAGLVATDPKWLKAAGVPFDAVRAVVSLDGAGIDVPGIMAAGASASHYYADAFGADTERQERLSPFAHIGAPDAPDWLFLYDRAHNQSAGFFAQRFATFAADAGLTAQVMAIDGTSHMEMLNTLGKPGDRVTAAVDEFLSRVIARVR